MSNASAFGAPARPLGVGGLAPAFLVALALHLAVVASLAVLHSRESATVGEQSITIDLAPPLEDAEQVQPAAVAESVAAATAGEAPPSVTPPAPPDPAVQDVAEAPTLSPVVTDAPEEPADEAPTEPETEPPVETTALPAEDQQQPDETPQPSAPVVAELPEDAAEPDIPQTSAVTPEEEVTAQAPPPPPPPQQKPSVRRETTRRRTTAPPPSAVSSSQRQGSPTQSRQASQGSAASGDPTLRNQYATAIRAAVLRRKRYPPSAQSARIEGTATVRFTVQRSGTVASSSLVRSAGNAALDQAALATVAPGASYPPVPEGLPGQMTFVVPLRFDIN
jgi:periplasmic protein TonB